MNDAGEKLGLVLMVIFEILMVVGIIAVVVVSV